MKIMTKEWRKSIDFLDLIIVLKPRSNKKIPFVLTDGLMQCVAKEDLYSVKTNFDFTEKEDEINFIMVPDTFDLEFDYLGDGKEINETTCKNDFMLQYINILRVISYIPDDVLKGVKDKRLLAFGYAEEQAKKQILTYIQDKYTKAVNLYEECCAASVKAEEGLTIREQFKEHFYIHSVPFLFDGVEITKVEKVKDEIHLTLEENINIVFSGAEIIEEETDILNSWILDVELYKKENCHEIHFLIMKRDENLVDRYYYVTYAFKDLKFED